MIGRQAMSRYWRGCLVLVWLTAAAAAGRMGATMRREIPRIITHDNTEASGKLEDGVLTLRLEIREGSGIRMPRMGRGCRCLRLRRKEKIRVFPGR